MAGKEGVTVRANVCSGRQLKGAQRAVKIQLHPTGGTDLILFLINHLAAVCAKRCFTFRTKAILDIERRLAYRTDAVIGFFLGRFARFVW
jgi:hypothetical protein